MRDVHAIQQGAVPSARIGDQAQGVADQHLNERRWRSPQYKDRRLQQVQHSTVHQVTEHKYGNLGVRDFVKTCLIYTPPKQDCAAMVTLGMANDSPYPRKMIERVPNGSIDVLGDTALRVSRTSTPYVAADAGPS